MNDKKIEDILRNLAQEHIPQDVHKITEEAFQNFEKTLLPQRQHILWEKIMRSSFAKLAAAAVIIATITIIATLWNKTVPTMIPTASASAAQVLLTEAAKAVEDVKSIHIKARMRTLPGDNFSLIGLEYDFVPIEMWKKVDDAGIVQWRIEKPGRVIATNVDSTIMLIKPNAVVKERPCRIGAFDTWCGHLMNVDGLIDNALKETMNRSNDQLCMHSEVVKSGTELVIEIESTAQGLFQGLFANDYLMNKFISTSDHKKVYRFDAETKLLKGFEVFVHTDKEDVLVFEVTDIEYNPQIDNGLFTLELPADVIRHQEPQNLDEKYRQMGPKEVAQAFFGAFADENWDEVIKFWTVSAVSENIKQLYGGLQIINIGEPFKSGFLYPGWFVPYEIRLRPREFNMRVSNANPAKRFVITGEFDGGMRLQEESKWSNEPEILPDNDTYAKMSPQEAVKAFYEAFSKLDFNEMRKFMPDSYVNEIKGELKEAAKHGIDVQKQLPVVEVGDAFWSQEQSAYFVKCRDLSRIKKWNLAVRNDNPAKRYVVDGGF
jgi:hypothetical protein